MDSDAIEYGIEFHKELVDSSFPFNLSYCQVIYAEPYWDEQINNYIIKHIGETNDQYKRLIYFPFEAKGIVPILEYSRPGFDLTPLKAYQPSHAEIQTLYNLLFSFHKRIKKETWIPKTPVLIRLNSHFYSDHRIIVYPLIYENEVQFHNLMDTIIFKLNHDGIFCSSIEEWPRIEDFEDKTEYADFVDRFYSLAYEIRERIEKLQLMGVSDFVIRNLIKIPDAKLSPILITQDYRIILPAYNNMEIEMPTLSKVVFFFYLRHPVGLRFKELIDYRDELLKIYCTISNRENLDKMKQSIDELVDSTSNSINEKCSRIRAAFVSQFADDLAHHYYITGNYASPKRITLDRNMIIDKSGITNN